LALLALVGVQAAAATEPVHEPSSPAHLPAIGSLGVSPPDESGRFVFEFDPGPIEIYRANRYRLWDHVVPMPRGTICEVRSFVGWDRGSLGEANLEVNVGATRLYERSEHKESPVNYDAWKVRRVRLDVREGATMNLHLGAVQTGPNVHDGGLSTRVHFAVRLTMSASGSCD
jgi:hypothetical protein